MAPGNKAGWYVRFDMYQTLGFWDGDAWTDQTAPSYKGIQPSVSTIAGGVLLGSVLVGLLAMVVSLYA